MPVFTLAKEKSQNSQSIRQELAGILRHDASRLKYLLSPLSFKKRLNDFSVFYSSHCPLSLSLGASIYSQSSKCDLCGLMWIDTYWDCLIIKDLATYHYTPY